MWGKVVFLAIVLIISCLEYAYAQPPFNVNENKIIDPKENLTSAGTKDSLQKADSLKAQTQNNNNGNLTVQENDTNNIQSDRKDVSFNLFQSQRSIVSEYEDLSVEVGESQIVSVSEELRIGEDSTWVKAYEHYAIWDINNINPYRTNAAQFNEVVNIELYNPNKGLLWAAPLETTLITSLFGPRWGRFHPGLDLNLQMGQPIYATFDGIVRISTYENGYGNYVVIRHPNGLETLYGHMSMRKVEVQQPVKAGQLIGLGGSTGWSTGPHLHLEVRYEGHPIDPALIFDFSNPKSPQIKSQYFILLPQHFSHLGNQVRSNIYHQVMMGETLQSISQKYGVPINTLAEMNQIDVYTKLKVGQRLKIR